MHGQRRPHHNALGGIMATSEDNTRYVRTKLLRIVDDLSNAVRYARGSIGVFCDTELEEYQQDAVGAIQDRLLTAQKLIDELNQWRSLVPSLAPSDSLGLHEQTIAEIREEHPEANDREVALRVAIRESMCMTRDEEQATYDKISAAMQS
jgi:hypothetical protein